MIEFVFATTAMLADLGSWIAVALLAWLLVGVAVAVPLGRALARTDTTRDDDGEDVL